MDGQPPAQISLRRALHPHALLKNRSKRVRIIGGALALGAVINVAVAWGCAAAFDLGHGRISELYAELPGERHWEVFRWDNAAGTRVFSKCWTGFAPGPCNHGEPQDLLASWGRIEPPDLTGAAIDEGWGLPLRTMSLHIVTEPAPGRAVETPAIGVLRVTMPRSVGGATIHLPALPLWGGFLLNTVIYALAVVVAWAAIRDLVRAIERRRARMAAA
ncbi:MAG: hypothetical protein ACYS1E_20550 [Planctomycetota bacterium]